MKRLLKSWVFWLFVAVPLSGAFFRYTYRRRVLSTCAACHSGRVESQWRFGVEGRWNWPVSARSETLFETRVYLDGWTEEREHRWEGERDGSYISLSEDDPEGLLAIYEKDAAFRRFMLSKRERGDVTRGAFRAALGPPFVGLSSAAELDAARRRALAAPWREEFARRSPFP